VPLGLALLLVMASSGGMRAAPAAAGSTWAADWALVGPQVKASGELGILTRSAGEEETASAASSGDVRYESPVRDMGHSFMAVGAGWRAEPDAGVQLEIRCSDDGQTWTPWQPLTRDDGGRDGTADSLTYSELFFGSGRFLQTRVTLQRGTDANVATLKALKITAIDASSGPASPALAAAQDASGAATPPAIISRAQWGADESLFFWTPEYAPVTHFVIHHTDAVPSDPMAAMRIIYYYHAVTQNWGDIGYNYVIDTEGRIYEGRKGGDGVIGGHARPYNTGTVGVAILGNYTAIDVPQPAANALVELLAWKCNLHYVHPLQSSFIYDNTFPNIMGHRDCNATPCPGDRAYAILPQVRQSVWDRMRALPPHVAFVQPTAGQSVGGIYRVSWRVSAAVTQLRLSVDGGTPVSLTPSAGTWAWNTTQASPGQHQLLLTATTDGGASAVAQVTVAVDNTAPTGSVSGPAYASGGVTLNLSCADCVSMQYSRDWLWESETQPHQPNTGRAIADSAAANGQAWLGRVGDTAGAWYGPYYCGLPAPGDYEAVFWLRSGRTDVMSTVAQLDVSDEGGLRILNGPLDLTGADFADTTHYQAVRLPFHYPDAGTTCQNPAVKDGLELRTWFKAQADLYLDRVAIFTAPQAFASTLSLPLPQSDGRYPIQVRFLDQAGNASPVYTQVVMVDHTPPTASAPAAAGWQVADAVSGLDASGAEVSLSTDGMIFDRWTPMPLTMAADGLSGLIAAQPGWSGRVVRVRVHDRAGNETISRSIVWPPGSTLPPPGPTPTPDPRLRPSFCVPLFEVPAYGQ
jgi:hypothetical protein